MVNFSSTFSFVQSSSYALIFIAMVIEGPIVTTAASFAASLGYLNIWLIFFLSLFADIFSDFLHYGFGYVWRRAVIERYGQYVGLKKQMMKKLEKRLHNNLGKSMIVIKFTPILSTPGLMLAGALKVPIKKFMFYSFMITLPRTIFFTAAGFYFGLAFGKLMDYFSLGQYTILFIVLFIILFYFISKRFFGRIGNEINKIK